MLKILELFGGIGACSSALTRLGIEYEILDYVEIDKYAVKSYNAIHETNFKPQDICKWDKDVKVDLIMHGSPCQDFSLAGKQAGGDKDSGTRSSLIYETIRIVEKLKPKYVIWENVKNILSKKHRHNFDAYLETMEQLGYKNYYQVLNAKDYGIPQNRERVFTVSILGNEKYEFPNKEDEANLQDFLEKDTNIKTKPMCKKAFNKEYEQIITSDKDIYQCNVSSGYQDCKVGIKVSPTIRANNNCTHILQRFEFPPKQELKLKLKDMLEDNIDEKYYLSEKMMDYIVANNEKWSGNNNQSLINKSVATTINTGEGQRRCDASNYISTVLPENTDLKVIRKYGIFDTEKSTHQAGSVYDENGLIPTLDTMQGGYRQPCIEIKCLKVELSTRYGIFKCSPKYSSHKNTDLRIRKLTPKECWRLMGFTDEEFNRAAKVNSNTQLYKQAGNSIVVNVLVAIFEELFK